MIIVGLTGGIGSGKTFVAECFANKGIPVYNSDNRGREINNSHPKVIDAYIKRYGEDIYQNGILDRKQVAQIVFSNKQELTWINNLIHPLIQEDFKEWCKKQNSPLILKEAAVLIESGAYKACDEVILVTAPNEVKIERVMQRDNMTKEQVLQRLQNQITDEERKKYATFIIYNDGIQLVEPQVEFIFTTLKDKI